MAMEPKGDWRIENCEFIRGEKLRRRRYEAPSKEWDHDHCMACWAKFADFEGSGIFHEGYATIAESKWGADYHWICPKCFSDLRESLEWVEVH